jgi:hypothetical protein
MNRNKIYKIIPYAGLDCQSGFKARLIQVDKQQVGLKFKTFKQCFSNDYNMEIK